MATHDLKTWPAPWRAVYLGEKTYEIRSTADRRFGLGDELRLWYFDRPLGCTVPNLCLLARVSYLTPGGEWGLPPNLAVLALTDVQLLNPELALSLTPPGPVREPIEDAELRVLLNLPHPLFTRASSR